MKFTKEELLSAIKAKLAVNGKSISMSQRTLEGMVNNHYLFVAEETDLETFVGQVLPSYEAIEGQLRHDISEFTKQWEKEHPSTPPTQQDQSPTPPTGDDAYKAILARLDAMEAEKKAEKAEKETVAKRNEILTKATEKGVSKEWAESYFKSVSVSSESDVEQMADNALQLFNMGNKPQPYAIPSPAGGGSADNEDMFGDVAKMRKQSN